MRGGRVKDQKLKQSLLIAVLCLGLANGHAETEEPDANQEEQAMMTQVAAGQREALRVLLRKHLLNLRPVPSKGATLTTDTIAAVPASATISMTKSTVATTTSSFSSTANRGTGEEEDLVENRVAAQPTIR